MSTAAPDTPQRLAHMPVTFFAVAMGLMGLVLAYGAGVEAIGLPRAPLGLLRGAAIAVFAAIAAGYAAKALRHFGHIRAEWAHPQRLAFFPAMSIALLLMAAALVGPAPGLARAAWVLGTAAQGALALGVIGAWIGPRPFALPMLTPAWFIPAVGNVIVPLAGARLGYIEISWLFFAGGMVFWLVLLAALMARLMFEPPMPPKMLPTLAILIAPPAVAFTAWLRLTGEVGAMGHFLLSAAYVFALLLLTVLPRLRGVPFALSWWGLSFPIAALSVASFLYAEAAASQAHALIGAGLLIVLVGIIAALIWRTGLAMARGQICVPE